MSNLGFKIKSLREENNITQEELAFTLGISQAKLSKIENGSTATISFSLVQKLVSQFEVNFDYFTDYTPEKNDTSGGGGGILIRSLLLF